MQPSRSLQSVANPPLPINDMGSRFLQQSTRLFRKLIAPEDSSREEPLSTLAGEENIRFGTCKVAMMCALAFLFTFGISQLQ